MKTPLFHSVALLVPLVAGATICLSPPAFAADPLIEAQGCKRVVVVDEQKLTWDKLEIGAEDAWIAYQAGNFVASVPVFQRLAKIGHPVAQWLMGNIYYFGQGVPQDYRTALDWFERAADQGCFPAFAAAASMYEKGEGTPADPSHAYLWYNIAAARLPASPERDVMIKRRKNVADLLTTAQIEIAQKRSLGFVAHPIVPPDLADLPDDWAK